MNLNITNWSKKYADKQALGPRRRDRVRGLGTGAAPSKMFSTLLLM